MFRKHYFYVAETNRGTVSGTVAAPLLAVYPGSAAIKIIESRLARLGCDKDSVFVTTLNLV